MSNQTPGVFIQEVSTLPNSVVQVSTAIPAIFGYTKSGTPGKPVRINSLKEYENSFGGPYAYKYNIAASGALTVAEFGTTGNMTDFPVLGTFFLYEAMQAYFANGGGPCYIIPVANFPGAVATASQSVQASDFGTAQSGAMEEVTKLDEPTLLLFPEAANLSLLDYKTLVENALGICAGMQDRFALLDTPKGVDLTSGVINATTNMTDLDAYRTILGSEDLKFGAAYYPHLESNYNWTFDETLTKLDGTSIQDLKSNGSQDYIKAMDYLNAETVVLPPSSLMAGVYAKTDANRGVWVAPANVALNGVVKPMQAISDQAQGGLNVDATAGKSINVIRTFTGKGTLVWGARTLAGNDSEWRYIPVRRLYLTAEESIRKAVEPFVFATNDAKTWVKVSSMISSYLNGLWQQGALVGAKPEEAFFVKVGFGTTMTQANLDAGEMIVEIGMAAVRPAEFIVMKYYHKVNQ